MRIDLKDTRRILRGRNFDFGYLAFQNDEIFKKLIHKKDFSIGKNSEASYRIMNHWEELGLILSNRKESHGWRRFSIYDLVWHLMILSLRDFGFPNSKILKVKDSLLDLKGTTSVPYPLFEYHLCVALALRKPVFAIIYSDGFADIGDYEDIRYTQKAGLLAESHISININNLLEKIFSKADLAPFYDLFIPLSKKELEIIKAIRNGKYKYIKIRFQNGKISLIEKAEDVDASKKIVDILKENKYQKIEIKTQEGKIISLERISQEKL